MTLFLPDPVHIVQGLVVTLAIAGVARGFHLVSGSGFLAGISVGVWVSLGLGSPGLYPVGVFFILGSAATRWHYADKHRRGIAEPDGGSRGAGRVLAKGTVGAALAVAGIFDTFDPALVRVGFAAAFAAAAADTLGTEVGQVLGRRPFTLIPPRAAAPGTPGAVSGAGTAAGAVGALLVALAAMAGGIFSTDWGRALPWALVAAAGGLLGSLVEAVLSPLLRKLAHRDLVANLVTTSAGAALAALGAALLLGRSGG